MQKAKKILALVLVLALLFSTPGVAFAITDSAENAVQVSTEAELRAAIQNAPTDETQVTIALTNDIVITNTLRLDIRQGRNIVLTSAGARRTIYQELENRRHFEVSGPDHRGYRSSLTLENIVLSGERTPGTITHHSGGVSSNGTLVMRAGAIIENSRYRFGSGVNIFGSGPVGGTSYFTMEDGSEIRNNVSTLYGGGVRIVSHATFVMNGGVIANNTAPSGGGIALNGNPSYFTMNGGQIIGNVAVSTSGGGIGTFERRPGVGFVSSAQVVINNGIIRNNIAATDGGGINIQNHQLTINAGFLTGNRAVRWGGAIYTSVRQTSSLSSSTLESRDYRNITIGADVVFAHNFAGQGAFPPPVNPEITNINTTSATIHNHPLNNNDIAFRTRGSGTVFDPGPCPGIENLPGNGSGNGNGGSGNGTDPDPFPFADVAAGRWYHPAVVFVHENGIMQGTAATTFAPTMDFSRAMVVTTLFRMYHDRVADTSDPAAAPFDDVAEGRWYAPYIAWAHSNGIVQGVSETRFRPQNAVSRQEFATMIYRFAQFADIDVNIPDDFALAFPDTDRVGSWAEDAVAWAVYNELIQGTGGQLIPTGTATRAQAATILMRFVPMLD
ncbi:MAG: S-layer homology domain-containing protein [Oscillospiraceae bacterium]|nr:S-layer homology domain-containing protein [Oscillospiraceae bacterium]